MCSLQKRMMLACPLAFGEVGVKNRVKSVLNYKKPAFWIVAVTVVAGVAVAICFLTNPISDARKPDQYVNGEYDDVSVIVDKDGSATIMGEMFATGEVDVLLLPPGYDGIADINGYRYGTEEKGLYVFIWQLAANSYSCCVMEKTEQGYTTGELWSMESMRVEDARWVVESSGYPEEAVTIVPFSMPYSSYLNLEASEDPEGYRQKLEAMFWGDE